MDEDKTTNSTLEDAYDDFLEEMSDRIFLDMRRYGAGAGENLWNV